MTQRMIFVSILALGLTWGIGLAMRSLLSPRAARTDLTVTPDQDRPRLLLWPYRWKRVAFALGLVVADLVYLWGKGRGYWT